MANAKSPSSESTHTALLVVLIVVAVLYFARTVIIPVALAVLLAFLLTPLSTRLRRWGFGRISSALAVVFLFFVILGVIGAVMTSQLTDLARELPGYQKNIHKKIESIRASGGGALGRISRLVTNFAQELTPAPPAPPITGGPNQEHPVPVEIRKSAFSPLEMVQKALGSVLEIALTAAIVLVFIIFILIEREDLRDRIIRLGGPKRVNATTKLLDDAAHRVSRYLLAQLTVNIVYGVLAGIGLFLIKVPNPFLWAMVAAMFRYIPYLGIWIAATMPAVIAFAVEPGWVKGPGVFGIYFGIDLLLYNFVEPLLYGSSTGLSPLIILVAAVFWTWLWGPIGLLLSTPLTVCVVVLGRHVPQLWFLKILLSDEPVLPPATRLYQRLLAMDLDEATEIAQDFMQKHSLAELYDVLVIPAMTLAEEDRHQGRLDEHRQRFIFQNARILIDELGESSRQETSSENTAGPWEAGRTNSTSQGTGLDHADVLCIPARDEADELSARMLKQLLIQRKISTRILPAGALAGESIEEVTNGTPAVACVLAVPPFGYVHARYLCRRLRAEFSDLKLVGAILTEQDVDEIKKRQPPLVADEIASNLRQALAEVLTLLPLQSTPPAQTALASK